MRKTEGFLRQLQDPASSMIGTSMIGTDIVYIVYSAALRHHLHKVTLFHGLTMLLDNYIFTK